MTPHFTEKDWEETREWIVPEQTKLRDYLSDLRQVEARWPDRSWAQQQVLPWNIRQQATIQEQKQRRKAYKGFTPGLQGAGAVYLQKTIPRNSWDKPDQSLLDPITDQLLQDPVVANDKRVYNRQTAELLIRDRLRGQTGVRVQTYDDRPPRLAALRASVRQFQKTHQKTPDALGRYQRKPTKDTRH
jgi:hypothetical protein